MKTKTKIVATISDKNCDIPFLLQLHEEGMSVVRLNTAHQTFDDSLKVIGNVRAVSDSMAIMIDTKGPEVRTRDMDPLPVKKGEVVVLGSGKSKPSDVNDPWVSLSYDNVVHDVPVGSVIMIDDGLLRLRVVDKSARGLVCEAANAGEILKNKSVNFPGLDLDLPPLTEKDENYIRFAAENGVDFIAHSFVRNENDVLAVQKIIDEYDANIKIIAKIENRQGVDNLDRILDVCYGVMVARGDLGVELPGEEVPLVQKRIIRKCIGRARPVIIATQMLESMIHSPRATRAEISDVANAVLDGADAVMLSGETAYGKYPVEAVSTMSRIARRVEEEKEYTPASSVVRSNHKEHFHYIIKASVTAAEDLDAAAILVPTRKGVSALQAASYRSKKTIYAACYENSTYRHLSLCYGVYPFRIDPHSRSEMVYDALKVLLDRGQLLPEEVLVALLSTPGDGGHLMNQMHINTVKKSLENYTKRNELLKSLRALEL